MANLYYGISSNQINEINDDIDNIKNDINDLKREMEVINEKIILQTSVLSEYVNYALVIESKFDKELEQYRKEVYEIKKMEKTHFYIFFGFLLFLFTLLPIVMLY